MTTRTTMIGWVGILLASASLGCGEPVDETDQEQVKASYALASTVFGDSGETTYVNYLESLDSDQVDFDQAREYPGWATIGAVDDMFFVADGETPKITRYKVGADGTLSENGELSFANHVGESPFYANTFASATTAYLDLEDRGHVIWNPSTLEIEGTETTDAVEEEKDGLAVFRAFRRGSVVRDGLVFQPYHWRGPNFYNFADTSKIVVYNAETNAVENVIEAPCPGLDIGTVDAEGNIYFTTWVNAPAAPIIEGEDETHSLCAVRIKAGETRLDTDWTRDLSEMTGGRAVIAMRILEGEVAVAAVLDHSRIEPASEAEPADVMYAANWELWRLNLAEGTGSKIEGTDHIAGGFYAYKLGGRFLALLPNGDYTSTAIYEIGTEGPAEELFTVQGWVYQMVEIN